MDSSGGWVLAKEAEWYGSMTHFEVQVPKGGVNSVYKSEVCDLIATDEA